MDGIRLTQNNQLYSFGDDFGSLKIGKIAFLDEIVFYSEWAKIAVFWRAFSLLSIEKPPRSFRCKTILLEQFTYMACYAISLTH